MRILVAPDCMHRRKYARHSAHESEAQGNCVECDGVCLPCLVPLEHLLIRNVMCGTRFFTIPTGRPQKKSVGKWCRHFPRMAAPMKDSDTCAMRRSWGPCLGSTSLCLNQAQQPARSSPTRLQTMEDAIRPSKPWPHARLQICSRRVLAQKARLTAKTSALKANSIAKGSSGSPRPAFRATPETTRVRKRKLNVPCALRAAIPSLPAHGNNARHVKGARSHRSMVRPPAPFAVQANSRPSLGTRRATGANQDPLAMAPFLTLVPSAHLAHFQTPLASQAVNHAETGPTRQALAFQPARCVGLEPIWSSLWPTPTTPTIPTTTPPPRRHPKFKGARLNAWSAVAGHTAHVRAPRRSAFLVQQGPSR